ncbi:MAG TPA: GatB/YqeY domain-containing protein [Anaerolineae bacterium]|nr:GatB/YqeY domain-containing protein [Anaerolineae bacterium]
MGKKNKIEKALLKAIRSRDKIKKRALRMAILSIKLAEINKYEELDEPTLFNILQKEIRIKQETIEELKKADRYQAVEVKYAEIAVIKKFLPQPISDDGLITILEQIIQ